MDKWICTAIKAVIEVIRTNTFPNNKQRIGIIDGELVVGDPKNHFFQSNSCGDEM
jgi:hypothetical protein